MSKRKSEVSEEYQRFEDATRKLLAIPKAEIDERIRKAKAEREQKGKPQPTEGE